MDVLLEFWHHAFLQGNDFQCKYFSPILSLQNSFIEFENKVIISEQQIEMVIHFLADLDSRFLGNYNCDSAFIRKQMRV